MFSYFNPFNSEFRNRSESDKCLLDIFDFLHTFTAEAIVAVLTSYAEIPCIVSLQNIYFVLYRIMKNIFLKIYSKFLTT